MDIYVTQDSSESSKTELMTKVLLLFVLYRIVLKYVLHMEMKM